MKKTTKIFSLLLAVMMSLSVIGIYADDIFLGDEYIPEIEYTEQLDEGLSEESDSEDELMPLAANGCVIPSSAYSAYTVITTMPGGADYYPGYHTYDNVGGDLPKGTTYTTYYLSSKERLIIGANGTAYYSPDHYSTFMKMDV